MRFGLFGSRLQHAASLDGHGHRQGVDCLDPVHPVERQGQPSVVGHRRAASAALAADYRDGNGMGMGQFHHGRNFASRRRPGQPGGVRLELAADVDPVMLADIRAAAHICRADDGGQCLGNVVSHPSTLPPHFAQVGG